MNEMYNRIEDLCKSQGINMTQMCKEAGIPRGNLTDLKKWENRNFIHKKFRQNFELFSGIYGLPSWK